MDKSTTKAVILMRHGQTEWNRAGKLQGQSDSFLTEIGYRQAEKLAEITKRLEIKRLFTSPLQRALKTAKIVGRAIRCEPKKDMRLMEMSFGLCEGLTRTTIERDYPGLLAMRESSRWNFKWPSGESYAQVYDRVRNFASDHLLQESEGATGIIAHETINTLIIGCLLDLSHQEIVSLRHPNDVIFYWETGKGIYNIQLSEGLFEKRSGLIYKLWANVKGIYDGKDSKADRP